MIRFRRYFLPAILCVSLLCGCAPKPPAAVPGNSPPETTPTESTAAVSSAPTETLPPQTESAVTVPETTAATLPTAAFDPTEATVPNTTEETVPITTEATETVPEEYTPTEPAASTFTVTFRDHDGQILAVRQVAPGQDAPLPSNPSRSGYLFAGWEGNHRHITADTVLTAAYVSTGAPNLFTLSSSVSGDTVSVAIRLQGDILACGIECHLTYDDSVLQYTSMTKHNSVEANHITRNAVPQIIVVWAGSQNMTGATIRDNGILLELEFLVTDPAVTDTVLSFLAEEMYVDIVDENGSYSNGQFTLTKGVIHLK